jgi:hypothetical protein
MTRENTSAALADRFFERQRQEILARIEDVQRRRRLRAWRSLLAAAALVVACLAGGLAVTGVGPRELPAVREAWPAPEAELWASASTGSDPLEAFGTWELGANEDEGEGSSDPLPPLELDQGAVE